MKPGPERSSWIPRRRLRLVFGLAAALTVGGAGLAFVTRWSLVLVLAAAGLAVSGAVMLQVRRALSSSGGAWQQRIHDLVAERLAGLSLTSHGLDIGCGDGSLLATVLRRCPDARWTGVDAWGDDWDYRQGQCEALLGSLGLNDRADFARMDAARLQLPSASFDLVTSVMCFHETSDPMAAVGEALRVLRPGGWFVLVDSFADPARFGPRAGLERVLAGAVEVSRTPLGALVTLPPALSGRRALGRVELIVGQKAGAAARLPSEHLFTDNQHNTPRG